MGARTEMMAFASGDIKEMLRCPAEPNADATLSLLQRLAPGWRIEPIEGEVLAEATNPPMGIVFAASIAGLDIVCGLDFLNGAGTNLPAHVLAEGAGRTIVLHRMHSASDSVQFAIWNDRHLVRALGIDGTNGVVQDVGEPLGFEGPYWAGERPHQPTALFGPPGPNPFPTGFHPQSLGNEAMRALFGFILEGRHQPDDIDAWAVPLLGFHLIDPDAPGAGERAEQLRAATSTMVRRTYEMGPDGAVIEVTT